MIVRMGTFCPSFRYLSDQNRSHGRGGWGMKVNLIQIQKWMWQTTQISDEEIVFIYVLFPCFLPESWSFKLPKIVYFFEILHWCQQNSWSGKIVCMCVFENSCCTLLDSDIAFRGQSYSLQDSKGTVMQIEKAQINDRLRVSKVSWNFRIPVILNLTVIYPWN